MTDVVDKAEIIGFALTLFVFVGAQAVTLFIWYHKHRRDQERDRREAAADQENHRKKQLHELKTLIDRDIGSVKEEVGGLRRRMDSYETVSKERDEQLHGHLRRIEVDRPTRAEMNKEISRLKEVVSDVKVDLTKAVDDGFKNLNLRFDEFKGYARALWNITPKE